MQPPSRPAANDVGAAAPTSHAAPSIAPKTPLPVATPVAFFFVAVYNLALQQEPTALLGCVALLRHGKW